MNRLKLWRAFCGVLAFFVNENALGRDPLETLRDHERDEIALAPLSGIRDRARSDDSVTNNGKVSSLHGPAGIAPAGDLIPWQVVPFNVRPYEGMWGFNAAIHFDGETWRCVVRCADYGMPGGLQIRGPGADARGGIQSRNLMLHLDPTTLQPVHAYAMHENDGLPRNRAANRGFEDMRLFRTTSGGLQGIAAAAHLERRRAGAGSSNGAPKAAPSEQGPPEQVVLTFDDQYRIVGALPIRGAAWAGPQKNWSPFDGADHPRFLYSIGRGIVFSVDGPIGPMPNDVLEGKPKKPDGPPKRPPRAAGPASNAEVRSAPQAINVQPTMIPSRSRYSGLRGGTQLVHLGDDQWLGLGHEMVLVRNRKLYWHAFYVVDSNGVLTHLSPSMKLCPEGIEFAAGMVVEPERDRVVVSFGVDDSECRLGITSLDAVIGTLQPYDAEAVAAAVAATKQGARTGWIRRDADPSPTFGRRPARGAPPVGTGGYRPARGPRT